MRRPRPSWEWLTVSVWGDLYELEILATVDHESGGRHCPESWDIDVLDARWVDPADFDAYGDALRFCEAKSDDVRAAIIEREGE